MEKVLSDKKDQILKILKVPERNNSPDLLKFLINYNNDYEIMINAIINVKFPFEETSEALRDQEEFVYEVLTLSFDKSLLEYASKRLLNSFSFLYKVFGLEFMEFEVRNGSPLQYLPRGSRFLNDKDIVLMVLKRYGQAIFDCGFELQAELIMKETQFKDGKYYYNSHCLNFFEMNNYQEKMELLERKIKKELEEKRALDMLIPPFQRYKEIEANYKYEYLHSLKWSVKRMKIDVLRNKYIFNLHSEDEFNNPKIQEVRGNYHVFSDLKNNETYIYFYEKNILILLFKEKYIDGTIHDLIVQNEIDWHGKKLSLEMVEDVSLNSFKTKGGPSGSGSSVVLDVETLKSKPKKKSTPPTQNTSTIQASISHICNLKCLVRCRDDQMAALPFKHCPLTPSDLVTLATGSPQCTTDTTCFCVDVINASSASQAQKDLWSAHMRLNNFEICRRFPVKDREAFRKVLEYDTEDFYGDF